ncbi:predicted protein [Uncinocarpus reesii 1704]|uniref:Uncharacterized protein n=1 Tax=Uncinocarpus reesii (strain UAMH 1704) TaxID=336963 RepID=C4JV95_UNCRE|nr:uncharacterized protein UREG_06487 [Uncinocarpus reesii 1704]EEP81622.1 predicted protein [Uncinocarpus reesii 1704]
MAAIATFTRITIRTRAPWYRALPRRELHRCIQVDPGTLRPQYTSKIANRDAQSYDSDVETKLTYHQHGFARCQ